MRFAIKGKRVVNDVIPILPGASTVLGMFSSSDIGSLISASSNNAILTVGTTADFTQTILGYVTGFTPGATGTTAGSTDPLYYQPVTPFDKVEADYSTTYSTTLPGSTDIGKFLGFSNTTTVAGAVLDMDTLSNVKGTTSGAFLKITGMDNTRRKVFGFINSSHLAQ